MPDLLEAIIQPPDPVKEVVTAKVVQNHANFVENQESEGFNFLDSGHSKFSCRRPSQPSRPVGFEQEAAFHIPINPIFGPTRGQIFEKMRVLALRALTLVSKFRWPLGLTHIANKPDVEVIAKLVASAASARRLE